MRNFKLFRFVTYFLGIKGTLKISRHHYNETLEEWLKILMYN
jgi:hypothetical protein